jgi:hypothetical protein
MPHITKIAKITLKNLSEKNKSAIPYEYEKEFNAIAKLTNFSTNNLKKLNDLKTMFLRDIPSSVKDEKVNSFEDVIPYILKNISAREDIYSPGAFRVGYPLPCRETAFKFLRKILLNA